MIVLTDANYFNQIEFFFQFNFCVGFNIIFIIFLNFKVISIV